MNHIKANLQHAKLLVIDDNDDQWLLMQQALRPCFGQITIQRTATPEQTLTLLREWQHQEWEIPKLILLDLYLPTNTDGWQLLRQIKAMDGSIRRIPIVLLTASVEPADIDTSYQLGVNSCLRKPLKNADWLPFFQQLYAYWWETVTLPPVHYGS